MFLSNTYQAHQLPNNLGLVIRPCAVWVQPTGMIDIQFPNNNHPDAWVIPYTILTEPPSDTLTWFVSAITLPPSLLIPNHTRIQLMTSSVVGSQKWLLILFFNCSIFTQRRMCYAFILAFLGSHHNLWT